MRTTITLPDDLVRDARELGGGRPLSEFAREALRERVERLRRERLAEEIDEGYRAEAQESSLDPEWVSIETEGL